MRMLTLLLLLYGTGQGGGSSVSFLPSCKLSEHRCVSTGVCLAQDRFCDGENDCEDKSDEPVYCTRKYTD